MKYLDIIDRSRIETVLRDLVRIPSVNPGFPNGNGETAVGEYVQRFFRALDIPYRVQPVEEGRENVIGTLEGSGDTCLLLEAHMDTVQTEGMTIDPFGAEAKDGKLYGRGACDTKASLAAMLIALETMSLRGIRPAAHVHVAAVVDEEITYRGVSALAHSIRAGELRCDGAIVGEPTGLDIIAAHKGVLRFHVDVQGRSAHSSTPSEGINAIEMMADVIMDLKERVGTELASRRHPLTGSPTLCISQIQGGVAPNTVAALCRITIDYRTIPGDDAMEVWERLQIGLHELERRKPGLHLQVREPFLTDHPLETPQNARIVQALSSAANDYTVSRTVGAPYCSDASKLALVGVPTVVFGPGNIAQAHTADEWVELEQVALAAAILIDTAVQFHG